MLNQIRKGADCLSAGITVYTVIYSIYMTLMTLGMVSFLGSSLHGAQALDTRTGRGVIVIHRLALLH